jgi:hypothetical protein
MKAWNTKPTCSRRNGARWSSLSAPQVRPFEPDRSRVHNCPARPYGSVDLPHTRLADDGDKLARRRVQTDMATGVSA